MRARVFHSIPFLALSDTCRDDVCVRAGLIFFPIFASSYMIRALQLLFFYRWGQAKLLFNNRDWYFENRWLLDWKTSATGAFIACMP